MTRDHSRTARLADGPLAPAALPLPPWPGEQVAGVFVRSAPGAPGGEPALFVHGLGGASTNWTDLMGLLSHRLAGDALDLPGFGRSDPPRDGSYRLSTHMAAVVRVIEERRRGPVHLFGNSLGGAVSTRVAATRPDLVRSLTLVSPALPSLTPRRGTDPRLPLLLVPGLGRLARRQLARQSPEQRAKGVIALCFADPAAVPEVRVQEAVEEAVRRSAVPWAEAAMTGSLRGLVGSYLERGSRSLWAQAAMVAAPTLLVWGAQDRLVNVALAPRALGAFRDGRLLVLPSVGHVAQLERPEAVARAFLAMIEDNAPLTVP